MLRPGLAPRPFATLAAVPASFRRGHPRRELPSVAAANRPKAISLHPAQAPPQQFTLPLFPMDSKRNHWRERVDRGIVLGLGRAGRASGFQGLGMTMDRFLITAAQSPHVREWWVWEYDLEKPRNLSAPDKRQHYAAKRLVGVFRDRRAAEQAIGA